MPSAYFVVRIVDVTGQPLRGVPVAASFDGGSAVVLSPAGDGIAEAVIPPGTQRVSASLAPAAPFWPATQDVSVDLAPNPPAIAFAGGQQFNTILARVATRGADFNLEVHFVLGQLRDVTDATLATAAAAGVAFATPSRGLRRLQTPVLNASGSGEALLNQSRATVAFRGSLFFAARQGTPKLVLLGHPGWNPPRNPVQARLPIPFHVFYHPAIPWQDTYPDGYAYLDLVSRYACKSMSDGGKAMLYQNNADTLKNVFVFPIGSQAAWMGDATNGSALYRLLQEAAFFVQRKQQVAVPLQPVGSVSLSCFSAGVRPLAQVVMAGGPPALQRALRNIFVFDGVFAGAGGGGETGAFCEVLARWFGAAPGRSLRIYTQSERWLNRLGPRLQLSIAATAAGGARESEAGQCSVLHLPTTFWQAVSPSLGYWDVHQIIPALFMEHAVTNSDFA